MTKRTLAIGYSREARVKSMRRPARWRATPGLDELLVYFGV